MPALPNVSRPSLALAGSAASVAFTWILRSNPRFLHVQGDGVAIAGLVAVVLGAAAFIYVLVEAWRGHLSPGLVIGLAIAYHVAILLLPVSESGDVCIYGLYGRMVSLHHVNPYVATPSMFPLDPMYGCVPPVWVSTTSVYGPLFTLMSAALATAIRDVSMLVLAYKLIAVTASLGIILLVASLARRIWPERVPFAVAAVGLNPVVLFGTIADAHNDVLVGLAVICALWLVSQRKELTATAVLVAGTLIKATAAIPLVLLIATVVANREPGSRLRALGAHAAVAAALTFAAAAPFLQTTNPTLGMAELATHQGSPAASVFLQRRVEWLVCRVGGCGLSGWTGVGVRLAFILFFLIGLFFIARSILRHRDPLAPTVQGAAWGWGLLLGLLTAPQLHPWYLVWALPLAWLLPRAPAMILIATSIAVAVAKAIYSPASFPDVYQLIVWFERIGNLAVVGVFAWFAFELGWRSRRSVSLDADRTVSPG